MTPERIAAKLTLAGVPAYTSTMTGRPGQGIIIQPGDATRLLEIIQLVPHAKKGLHHLQDLAADLAGCDPVTGSDQRVCTLCHARFVVEPSDHYPECPWRRAWEYQQRRSHHE